MARHRGMTDLQERFVQEYLIDLNATAAAARAGYKNASKGRQLVTKSHIAVAIQEAKTRRQKRTEITQDKVLDELWAIASSPASDTPNSELRYSSKLKALELLGKHLGMFTDRIALTRIDDAAIQAVEDMIHDAAGSR